MTFLEGFLENGVNKLGQFSFTLLTTIIFIVIAYLVIKLVIYFLNKALNKTKLDPGVKTFTKSFTRILLLIIAIIAAISMLGIKTTSITAILASVGVSLGMALSGNLQNFAGGLVILITKPFGVGSVIYAQNVEGVVSQILIFHTVIKTYDNKVIYIPNGALSSGVITNISRESIRRNEWNISIEYGSDLDKARKIIHNLLVANTKVLNDPVPEVVLKELGDNGLIFRIRAWSKKDDLWDVYFSLNNEIYEEFTKAQIGFPYPQIQIHQSRA